ncbi:uncharacterized [Tachysurus ichikawai]
MGASRDSCGMLTMHLKRETVVWNAEVVSRRAAAFLALRLGKGCRKKGPETQTRSQISSKELHRSQGSVQMCSL